MDEDDEEEDGDDDEDDDEEEEEDDEVVSSRFCRVHFWLCVKKTRLSFFTTRLVHVLTRFCFFRRSLSKKSTRLLFSPPAAVHVASKSTTQAPKLLLKVYILLKLILLSFIPNRDSFDECLLTFDYHRSRPH